MNPDPGPYRRRYVELLADHAPDAPRLARVGLGVVLVLAGAHKLVAPGVWARYAPRWLTAPWPDAVLGFESFVVLNGWIEVAFGVAIVANVLTAVLAGITALSLLSVVLVLGARGLLAGEYVDVAIRDLGLAVLAAGVALDSARRSSARADR